jgi:hypothetical protein
VVVATSASTGLQVGLVLTALGLGFRHGIDWDHIAALTDITGSQETRRRSMVLATLYAVGHALVVFALGVLAIVASAEVPHWLDDAMGRVVGITLVALGLYVVVSLARHGRDFRMRSRWMLLFAGVRRAVRWTTKLAHGSPDVVVITHEHEHPHGQLHAHDHPHALVGTAPAVAMTTTTHRHLHHHVATVPDDPFPTYGPWTALAVGALHGIGAETPTQILVFLAAARAGGAGVGIGLLLCFIAGLLTANTAVALTAAFGFIAASRNFPIYVTVSVVTAAFSLVVGTMFLLGQDPLLPTLTGG